MSAPRLTYYADDFTGATDALDALASAGIETALFIDPPTAAELAGAGHPAAVGVAGNTRSQPEEALRETVAEAFTRLAALGAPLNHYKVCSTFDSSPRAGSIGAAAEEGLRVYGGEWAPILVGVPALGRWCVFGNLFARAGADGPVERLDRHPVSRHPATPMSEADLLVHLAAQTSLPSGLVVTHLADSRPASVKSALLEPAALRLFDVADRRDLKGAGETITAAVAAGTVRFIVGSSGVQYALAACWGDDQHSANEAPAPDGPTLVLSGSCSAVTAAQIRRAVSHGQQELALAPGHTAEQVVTSTAWEAVIGALRAGRPAVVHTALGPEDPRVESAILDAARLGGTLAKLAEHAIEHADPGRLIVIGGDTSSGCARALGIRSVSSAGRFIPGAPVCIADAPGRPVDGKQIVFKGGSLGGSGLLA